MARVSVIKLNHHRVQVFFIARGTCNRACPAYMASPAHQKAGAGRQEDKRGAEQGVSATLLHWQPDKPDFFPGALEVSGPSCTLMDRLGVGVGFAGQVGWLSLAPLGYLVLYPLVPHTSRHTLHIHRGKDTSLHFLPDVSNRLWPICLFIWRPLFSPIPHPTPGPYMLSCPGVLGWTFYTTQARDSGSFASWACSDLAGHALPPPPLPHWLLLNRS